MRGYLNIIDKSDHQALREIVTRKYFVIRRPYLFVYDHEEDGVERKVINLTGAQLVYSEQAEAMQQRPFMFSLSAKSGGFNLQAGSEKALYEWLEAIDPLYVGTLASRKGTYSRGSGPGGPFGSIGRARAGTMR